MDQGIVIGLNWKACIGDFDLCTDEKRGFEKVKNRWKLSTEAKIRGRALKRNRHLDILRESWLEHEYDIR